MDVDSIGEARCAPSNDAHIFRLINYAWTSSPLDVG
jgi:hypothetical protein